MTTFKLSPSDFAFLWEQCKRCFYLKVVHGIRQPSMPMARIFKVIEELQMELYEGKPTSEVSADLPPGIIRCGERWVESDVIQPPGKESSCYLLGKLDSLIEFEDKSWGVLDFKTTKVKSDYIHLYSRQLNSYAYGLENPSKRTRPGKEPPLALSPISKIGLLCFEPSALSQPTVGRHSYEGDVAWIEMEKNFDGFLGFLSEVLDLLEGSMPEPTSSCNWCNYGATMASGPFTAGTTAKPGGLDSCPRCSSPMRRREGRRGPFLGCSRYPDCRGTRDLAGS